MGRKSFVAVIAAGITIGGVEVGGLTEAEAEAKLRHQLLDPRRETLEVRFGGQTWKFDGKQLKLHSELAPAVAEALDRSQEAGLSGRLVRYVSGAGVEASIQPRVTYSEPAINRFVRHLAAEIDRAPRDAGVEPSADSLGVVSRHQGRKLRDNLLTDQLEAAVSSGGADRAIEARVLDRGTFTLRLWQHLKPTRTYTVAVGQEGLETPEGLY